MSLSQRGRHILKLGSTEEANRFSDAIRKEGAGLMGIGKNLMDGAKDLGRKILDGMGEAGDTARLMKEYPEEVPGYIGQKGKEIADEYGSELGAGAAGAGAGAAGMGLMGGDDKEASVRARFGLGDDPNDTNDPSHSGRSTNRFY